MRLLIAAMIFFTPGFAKELQKKTIECPSYIFVETSEVLARPEPKWTVSPESKRRELEGCSLFDGPPEQMADLVPSKVKDLNGKASLGWKLDSNNKRGYWLVCRYGLSNIKLAQPVPNESSYCVHSDKPMIGINPLEPTRKRDEVVYCY